MCDHHPIAFITPHPLSNRKEYPELSGDANTSQSVPGEKSNRVTVLEVGCGVGNSIWPLMQLNPDKFFYAFDCSPAAIDLVKAHAEYNPEKCCAFVLDICANDFGEVPPPSSVDIVLLTFVLSALAPQTMLSALQKIHKVQSRNHIVFNSPSENN